MLPHKTNRNRRSLFKTVEIEHSGFVETGDSQGRRRATMRCFFSGQTVFGRWRCMNHNNFEG
jgi:hypothetical protein